MTVIIPNIAWIILLLPLAASVLITLFCLRKHTLSGLLSCAAVVVTFALALLLFFEEGPPRVIGEDLTWLALATFRVGFALTLDPLSKLMMLIVTGVGALIQIYSLGYMADDPGKGRYFAKMSFFTFSMLGVVLSSNFIQLFIFWELVGLSSYLLIGFWYERASAAEAAKKAFLVNRIGDFGLLVGILMLWSMAGTFDFNKIPTALRLAGQTVPTVVALLIFSGAVAKSAQFPLHVWLPDAMEGPTPVSALIHAATMVAAGVYMLCRVFVLLAGSPSALLVICWVGAITALLSALIGCVQNDIKRVLAYSTLSQLGLMVMAVGLGGTSPAMFHLTTHAFFKALLFLAAGSVIIALHHEQNIWKMGGLRQRMPVTFWTFVVGAAAISGAPPLSGFFSKDAILALAAEKSGWLFAIGLLTTALTAFYVWRLCFIAFFGPVRSERAADAKESSRVVTYPLLILSALSIVGGFFAVPRYLGGIEGGPGEINEWLIWASAFAVAAFGFAVAWVFYGKSAAATEILSRRVPRAYKLFAAKFYFDEVYLWLVANVQQALAVVCSGVDRILIGGLGVRGVARALQSAGWVLRRVQRGDLSVYAFTFVVGLLAILYYVLIR